MLAITDRYLIGTRLRLREVVGADGTIVRKLGHKVRIGVGPAAIAHTSFYLDDAEWSALSALPARTLHKRRHLVERDGHRIAIDEHEDGTLVAEIDDGDSSPREAPTWLSIIEDVSDDERWTGGELAH